MGDYIAYVVARKTTTSEAKTIKVVASSGERDMNDHAADAVYNVGYKILIGVWGREKYANIRRDYYNNGKDRKILKRLNIH